MNLNNINKALFEGLFTLVKDNKQILFKKGEIIKGEILQQLENYLLIDLGEKGIVKAYSDINISNKEVFLKVISNTPQIILKLLSGKSSLEEININTEDFINALKEFPEIKNKVLINKSDLKNITLLQNKIKNLPKEIGFDFEKEILNIDNIKESLKYKLIEKGETLSEAGKSVLNMINAFQKLDNQFQFFIPIFFNEASINKGWIAFKKKNINEKKDETFSIVIFLELSENRQLQINITSLKKDISISFISNNQRFLEQLQDNFQELKKLLLEKGFNVFSFNFKFLQGEEFDFLLKNILEDENNFNIVDIKT